MTKHPWSHTTLSSVFQLTSSNCLLHCGTLQPRKWAPNRHEVMTKWEFIPLVRVILYAEKEGLLSQSLVATINAILCIHSFIHSFLHAVAIDAERFFLVVARTMVTCTPMVNSSVRLQKLLIYGTLNSLDYVSFSWHVMFLSSARLYLVWLIICIIRPCCCNATDS